MLFLLIEKNYINRYNIIRVKESEFMKNLFKLLLCFLFFIGIRVYADSIPTITLDGLYTDDGDPIALVDGVYKNAPEDFNAIFNATRTDLNRFIQIWIDI